MVPFKMKHKTPTASSYEFMHAIGLNHEQNRGDQAQNVRIHYGWFQVFSRQNLHLKPIHRNFDPGLDFAFEVMRHISQKLHLFGPEFRKNPSYARLGMDAPWLWI